MKVVLSSNHKNFSFLAPPLFLLSLACSCFLWMTSPCLAEVVTLSDVVVTATRHAQTVDESLASVTVIDREQIERHQATNLVDILRGIPGLDFSSNGGLGKSSSIFLRGTESDHVLVLVDGVKISSATVGIAAFQDIPVAQIERIEIVRGPRSSLYGSEAMGGVIQIFTRKGRSNALQTSIGAGNDATYQVNASLTRHQDQKAWWYNFSVNHLRTQGVNTCRGSLMAGCFTIEPDEDGFENTSVSARLGYDMGKNNFEFNLLRTQGNNEYDSSWNNEMDFVQQVVGAKTSLFVSDSWDMSLNISNFRDEETDFGHDIPENRFNTQRTALSWQNNIVLSEANLTVGYDYQRDKVNSHLAYQVSSRNNHGLFAQYQAFVEDFNLLIGTRYDDNEQFGGHVTGNISVGYPLSSSVRLVSSYGTAFKAPSFNELYYPDYGNPILSPEESESLEFSLVSDQQQDNTWILTAYHTQIKELIGGFPVSNISKSKISGLEGSISQQLADWRVNFNVSWLKAENQEVERWLPRRAKRTAKMELVKQFDHWSLGAVLLTQSQRFEDSDNTQSLAGYGVFNVYGEYRIAKDWVLRLRGDNLFDKSYETAHFYRMPGRSLFLSIHYEVSD